MTRLVWWLLLGASLAAALAVLAMPEPGARRVGAAVTLAAIATTATAAFFVGTTVAGAGFGLGLLGANRTLFALAAAGQRASLIADRQSPGGTALDAYTACRRSRWSASHAQQQPQRSNSHVR